MKSFSLQGEKRNQTVFTKGKQTKALKKKNPSLFLKTEHTKGQGGLRLTVPAPSLEKRNVAQNQPPGLPGRSW